MERDGNLVNVMSSNFCGSLIDVFREFVLYKVNYIDPLVINGNYLMNCYYNTNKHDFDFTYNVLFEEVNKCIMKGGITESCIKVC